MRVEPSWMWLERLQEMLESAPAPSAMWEYREKSAVYEPGSGLSPDTSPASTSV